MRRARQQQFVFPTWGGKRKGAGRKPKGAKPGVHHSRRPELDGKNHPVHVTWRVADHVYNLRSGRCMKVMRHAFRHARERFGFRLIHFNVEGNHLHLIAEADDRRALTRGLKGLAIRIARGLNTLMGRSGAVFADRYHVRVLRTPREVRLAIRYVLQNAEHHFGARAQRGFDPCSSAAAFGGWRSHTPVASDLIAAPKTWLLRVGWHRGGGLLEPSPS